MRIVPYWEGDPDTWALIGEVQHLKERMYGHSEKYNSRHSTQYVITNPVTGQAVTKEDLIYATKHMRILIESGRIRDDRWAFLWYH
jgi:hypothetical protein